MPVTTQEPLDASATLSPRGRRTLARLVDWVKINFLD